MELTELTCRRCNAPLQSSDIHQDLGLVCCPHCGTIFCAEGDTGNSSEPQATVPLPSSFTLRDEKQVFEISYNWYRPAVWFLWLVFILPWNAIIFLAWWLIGLRGGGIFLAFISLFSIAGLFFAYLGLGQFVNYTSIRVESGELQIYNGPLPWWGNMSLPAGLISQIYCQEIFKHHRHHVSVSYEICAMNRAGDRLTLLSGFDKVEEVLFIEQALERRLGI